MMKKVVCLFLILCLLPACAFGEVLSDVLARFAVYSEMCGAPELPDTENRIDYSSYYMVEYRIADGLTTGFMESGGEITGGFAICRDTALQGDFLALCASHAFTICGATDAINAYPFILDGFLEARQGRETEDTPMGDMMFSVFPMESGIAFLYSIIKK